MLVRLGRAAALSLLWCAAAGAQPSVPIPGAGQRGTADDTAGDREFARPRGLQIYNISVSSSYSTGAFGVGLGGLLPNPEDTHVVVLQASTGVGYVREGIKGSFSIEYSPAYARGLRLSKYSSFNQSLSLAGQRRWTKWTWASSARAMVNDFNQLLFMQNRFGRLTMARTGFDEFAAAILSGSSADILLAQAAAGGGMAASPETAFVFGNRFLSASAQTSLSYAPSPRSSFTLSLAATRMQNLPGGEAPGNLGPVTTLPRTTAGNVNFGWGYALTPRMNLSVNASTGRVFSLLQDAYVSRTGVSLGRTLSRSWFVQGSVGAGKITPLKDSLGASRSVQREYSGSVGYKVFSHTFLGSYGRAVADIYGLGANATETSGGGWSWQRPGASYGVTANAGYSRLVGPVFQRTSSWSANASFGKRLTSTISMTAAYTYSQFPESLLLLTGTRAQQGVILSVGWSPFGFWR